MNRKTSSKSRQQLGVWLVVLGASVLFSSGVSAQELTLEESYSRFLEQSPLVAAEKEKLEVARGMPLTP